MDHIWSCLANYTFIFHKTEIPMVILRYWTSLNFNWYKGYDKRQKNIKDKKDANICFCTELQKKKEMEIFAFCVTTFQPIIRKTCWAPQNDRQNLSFVKDDHTHGKKMARKGRTKVIYKGTFVCIRTLTCIISSKNS